jgi:prohibitin 1
LLLDSSLVTSVIISSFALLVDGGHRAVIFDRFAGVKPNIVGEGTHFLIPWVQKPIIFDVRSRPRSVGTETGSKGLVIYIRQI